MKKQTLAIDTPYQHPDAYGALSMPVYHCAAYEFDNAEEMADAFCGRSDMPDYSRVTNPTVTYFERKVAALAEAAEAVAFSSGMAAISNTLFCLASQGRTILTSRHLFGNTFALIGGTMLRFGVRPKLCDLTDIEAVENAIDDTTCCIFMEIITNPQMEIADIRALADVAHRHNIPLVADTTTIPFTQFSAKALGVDIEVVSSTKYISGGATSIGGVVIDYGTHPNFGKRMRQEMLMNLGAYMSPHVAYMQTVGLETLDARYRVQADNALTVAKAIKDIPGIQRVRYPGLADDPYHDIARRQFGETSGAMLTIDIASKEACYKFIDNLRLIRRATNLFDNRSLAIHPASTIFGNFNERQREKMDILDTTIRLSIGLEAAEDIIEDIKGGLKY
ncbi:O-acetylhomoserine sulfhydrylase [Prevotella sp. P5-92]|uniref:trans-sulfuration enzyme family protein n=1 Tax=Prevotella sp. P5-92 TaxID=2024222 RepID=UPI000B9799B4|nr:PLP-dependent aspartate aminotransferase family protein [Prevotella sp. P5-92]OYP58851.1 O-acetylhomoserine sulfhydrylase [Prevotella sp. P5-92]